MSCAYWAPKSTTNTKSWSRWLILRPLPRPGPEATILWRRRQVSALAGQERRSLWHSLAGGFSTVRRVEADLDPPAQQHEDRIGVIAFDDDGAPRRKVRGYPALRR